MAGTALAWVFIDVPPAAYEAARGFWARALGQQPVPGDSPDYTFFPTTVPVHVGLQRIGARDRARVHLDLSAADVEAGALRLERLGATRVQHAGEHIVLRDPAGLLLCVVQPRWAAEAPVPRS